MPASSADDELLLILLRNLRNAAATFGESTPQYSNVKATVEEHLRDMKDRGVKTNLAQARQQGLAGYKQDPSGAESSEAQSLVSLLETLTVASGNK